MKAHLLFSFALLSAASAMQAGTLTPAQALARLDGQASMTKAPGFSTAELKITRYEEGKPVIYLFSRGSDKGFIAVSADDNAAPLLGYGMRGTLPDRDSELPEGLKYWLGELGREIASNTNPYKAGIARADRTNITPLTKTLWDQSTPYNDECPEIDGKKCMTGCVATAMAQVLNYYKYPAQGTGSHSYVWNHESTSGQASETLSLDYASTTFDWDNMTDTYGPNSTPEQKAAVATLMKACGYGVDMNYGTSESGAVSFHAVRALIENFGYDKGLQYLMRDYYAIDEWEQIIYDNLSQYGPVLYGGQSNDGGHEFVCDGYENGYFHFNWGWSGLSDGYFLLTALDPESQGIGGSTSGYNFDQDIIVHLSTRQVSTSCFEQILWQGDFTIDQTTAKTGELITYRGGFYSFSSGTLEQPVIGLSLVPDDGGEPLFLEYSYFKTLEPMQGIGNGIFNLQLPQSIPSGTYTVAPAFYCEKGNVKTMKAPINRRGSYVMRVEGDDITFGADNPAGLKVEGLTLESELYLNTAFKLKATLTDTSDTEEYFGEVVAMVYNGDTPVARGDAMQLDLQPVVDTDWEYVSTLRQLNGVSVQSDENYNLYLCRPAREGWEKIAGPLTAVIHPEPTAELRAEALSVTNDGTVTQMYATATLKCTEGYFAGSLPLIIFPGEGGSEIASYQSGFVSVSADQAESSRLKAASSTALEYRFDLSGAKADTEYLCAIYRNGQPISEYVRFKTGVPVGIEDTALNDSEITEREYFTVTGMSIGNDTPQSGIYIVRETHADGSVTTRRVAL